MDNITLLLYELWTCDAQKHDNYFESCIYDDYSNKLCFMMVKMTKNYDKIPNYQNNDVDEF